MGLGGQRHAPAALPPGKTRCLLYRRLGGAKGRSGHVRKISAPLGFDPRTVQPLRVAIPTELSRLIIKINKSTSLYERPKSIKILVGKPA